jgi:hypothetical protein
LPGISKWRHLVQTNAPPASEIIGLKSLPTTQYGHRTTRSVIVVTLCWQLRKKPRHKDPRLKGATRERRGSARNLKNYTQSTSPAMNEATHTRSMSCRVLTVTSCDKYRVRGCHFLRSPSKMRGKEHPKGSWYCRQNGSARPHSYSSNTQKIFESAWVAPKSRVGVANNWDCCTWARRVRA